MPVTIVNQTLELDGIQTVLVSDIQPDTNTDYFVRVLTLYTDPPTVTNRIPVLIVKLFGGSQQNHDQSELELTTPSLQF
jgi:hypothetical protein